MVSALSNPIMTPTASAVTYTIRKNQFGEYVVRFHHLGVFKAEWTAFETSKESAKATAEATVRLAQ